MDITKIDAMLAQLKTGAALAAGKPVTFTAATGMHKNEGEPTGVDFSTIIRKSLDDVSHAQGRAAGLARDFEVGAPNANLTEAMIAMQKASLSFQYTLQVRNKLVSAYQEIMNMPV